MRDNIIYHNQGIVGVIVGIIMVSIYFMVPPIQDTHARYEAELTPAAKLSMAEVYLEPADPNDPIYQLIVKPTPEWTAKFHGSERSRIFFNLSQLNTVMVQLLQKVTAQEKRIVALEALVNGGPNNKSGTGWSAYQTIDPNGVKE